MKNSLLVAVAVAALGAAGCASQKPMSTPSPASTSPVSDVHPGESSYVVHKGDCLWTIAGKSDVLGDPFRWPLLFKANRDQIQDPDFIQVDEDLAYQSSYTGAEIADAVKKAELTPKFVSRQRPRKVLPIQY